MCHKSNKVNGPPLPPDLPGGENEDVDDLPGGEDEDEAPDYDYDTEEEELDALGDDPYVWGLNLEEDVEVAQNEDLIRYAQASRQEGYDPEAERDAEDARLMAERMMERVRQIESDMDRVRAEREASSEGASGAPSGVESEEQKRNRIRFKRGIKAIEAHVAAFKAAKMAKYGPDRDGTPPPGGGGGARGGNGAVPSA